MLKFQLSVNIITSGVVAGGAGGQSLPPSDNFLGALKSQRGAKIRNSNLKYYTKYVKSSLSTNSKILKHLMHGKGPDCFLLKTAIFPISVFLLLSSMKFHTELENDQHDSFQ